MKLLPPSSCMLRHGSLEEKKDASMSSGSVDPALSSSLVGLRTMCHLRSSGNLRPAMTSRQKSCASPSILSGLVRTPMVRLRWGSYFLARPYTACLYGMKTNNCTCVGKVITAHRMAHEKDVE